MEANIAKHAELNTESSGLARPAHRSRGGKSLQLLREPDHFVTELVQHREIGVLRKIEARLRIRRNRHRERILGGDIKPAGSGEPAIGVGLPDQGDTSSTGAIEQRMVEQVVAPVRDIFGIAELRHLSLLCESASSSAFASFRSSVSKPSVNQSWPRARRSRASPYLRWRICRNAREVRRVAPAQRPHQPAHEQPELKFANFGQDGADPLMHLVRSARLLDHVGAK